MACGFPRRTRREGIRCLSAAFCRGGRRRLQPRRFMLVRRLGSAASLWDQPVGPQKRRGSCHGSGIVCPLKSRTGPGVQGAVAFGGVEGHQAGTVQHRRHHQAGRRRRAPRAERAPVPGQHQGGQHSQGQRGSQPAPDRGGGDLRIAFGRPGEQARFNSRRGPAWFPGTQLVLRLSPVVHTLLLSGKLSASSFRNDIGPPPCSATARATVRWPRRCARARP